MLPAPFTPELLARLEGMRLRAARKQAPGHGPGRHTGSRPGAGLEFADYRKYAPGDDLRYLDWGLLARTDRLYVKVFQEEADLSVHLFLDASASMRFPSQAEKFTPACRVALALAYAVLANGDRVRFHFLQDAAPGLASPLFRGRRSIMEAHAFVDGFAPGGALRLSAAIGRHLRSIHRPGKAVVVSDFLMEAEDCRQGFRALQAAGFEVSALQVLSAAEMDPPFAEGALMVQDSETGAEMPLRWNGEARRRYREALDERVRELAEACRGRGVHTALYVAERNTDDDIVGVLTAMGVFE